MELNGQINLKLLQTFMVVATEGSFRQAAERLHRSHSAISIQIKHLEGQLGVRLFDRTTRVVKLTPEGKQLRESSTKALYELQLGLRQVREAGDFARGQLSIACSSNIASIHLPPILTNFVQDYPHVTVSIRELTSRELFGALNRKEVDFALGPQPDDEKFDYTTIIYDPVKALIPPNLVAPGQTSISWSDLAKLPLLLPSADTAMRGLVGRIMERLGVTIESRYQFIQAETIIAMAEAGLGAAVQPASRISRLPAGTALQLDLINPDVTRKMALITRRDTVLTPAARRFAETIIDTLSPSDAAAQ